MNALLSFINWVVAPVHKEIFIAATLLMLVGIWLGGFNTTQAFAFGALGLLLAIWGGAAFLIFRGGFGSAMLFGLRASAIMLLPAVVVAFTFPVFRMSFSLSATPVPVDLQTLSVQRPQKLPENSQASGLVREDLTLSGTLVTFYRIFFFRSTTYFTPLVAPGWQPGDPVSVVTTTPPDNLAALTDDVGGQKIVTGILYPVVPRGGEAGWPDAAVSEIGTLPWFQQNAGFPINPDSFYILDDTSLFSLRLPFLIVLGIIVLAGGAIYGLVRNQPLQQP